MPPGRSSIVAKIVSRRPDLFSCRRISPGTTPRSTLPPGEHDARRAGLGRGDSPGEQCRHADRPSALDVQLRRSISSTIASAIDSSSTVTISSIQCSMSGP